MVSWPSNGISHCTTLTLLALWFRRGTCSAWNGEPGTTAIYNYSPIHPPTHSLTKKRSCSQWLFLISFSFPSKWYYMVGHGEWIKCDWFISPQPVPPSNRRVVLGAHPVLSRTQCVEMRHGKVMQFKGRNEGKADFFRGSLSHSHACSSSSSVWHCLD